MLQRCHLDVDGLRVSFLEQGEAVHGQPSLVILHGLMGSAATFVPMVEQLAPELHVLIVDLPGSGQSDRRDTLDASMGSTATIVENFLYALGLKGVCLLGHSHGGAVALRLARTAPRLVDSLVLLAPANPYSHESDSLIRFYLSLPGRLFAYTMPWYPRWVQMLGLRRMAGPKSWDTPERLTPYRENLRTPGTVAHLLRIVKSWNIDMAELRKLLKTPVEQPVLVVWGDSDLAVPAASWDHLRRKLRRSRMTLLSGVGHRPAEERAEETAKLITEWMQGGRERMLSHNAAYAGSSSRPVTSLMPNVALTHDRNAALIAGSFDSGD